MEEKEFSALVESLEGYAREHPGAYKLRVAPHGLEPEVIRKLHDQLSNHPDIAMAHLVQKVVQHFPQEPAYVLGIVVERISGNDSDNVDQRLIDKLAEQIVLPNPAYIVPLDKQYKPLRKVFEQMEGSEIYRAERYKANKP